MFTGIIKEIGKINRVDKKDGTVSIVIGSREIVRALNIGDSVAVNGACLTAVNVTQSVIEFDVMEETARRSTIANLREGDTVNLEGSMKVDGVFGGHFVQGHVDCVGIIKNIGISESNFAMNVELPKGFEGLYVNKGSVTLDGVSLTIGKTGANSLEVYVIPHTLKATTLGSKKAGDKINVEFDIIGKYIAKARDAALNSTSSKVTEKFLEDSGFI